ncbi:MAG TPA: septum formation family protein [Candidatus Limnocylindrales bacterium]|nr:septum formation family protein [Candidatus Limnocylindrales bacterium]
MRRGLIWIGILIVVGIGALIFRDRLSSNAGELKVGDCFDDPAGATEVNDVQHHPCTESHTAEVVYLAKMDGEDSAYPADSSVEAWVTSNCLPAWSTYTGRNIQTEEVLTLGWYQPTNEGWSKGDRLVICYGGRVDLAPMTSSIKAAS